MIIAFKNLVNRTNYKNIVNNKPNTTMKVILIIVGLAILAVALYFSIQLWEAHRFLAILISAVGAFLGVKIMMA